MPRGLGASQSSASITTMPGWMRTPLEREATSEAVPSRAPAWRIAFATLALAFVVAQVLDFATAQGLATTEPKGYFAEVNPLLAQVTDPVARQYVGFALKVALVIFVVWVASLQRRRAVGRAVLMIGTGAGSFGAWSNLHPWG